MRKLVSYTMKRKFLLTALLPLSLLCACAEEKEEAFLNVDEAMVDFSSSSDAKGVSVTTNVEGWTAEVASDGQEWCHITRQKKSVLIAVDEYEEIDQRETKVYVRAGALSKEITVTQLGLKGTALIQPRDPTTQLTEFRVLKSGGSVTFEVTVASVEFKIVNEDPGWIHQDSSATPDSLEFPLKDPVTYRYVVDANDDKNEERTGRLVFKDMNDETLKTKLNSDVAVIITQAGKFEIVKNPEISNDIKVKVLSGTASVANDGEGVERSFDGDAKTLYHSPYGGVTPPVTLTYTLESTPDKPNVLDYFIYYPRSDGNKNGAFKGVQILVKRTNADFVPEKYVDFGGLLMATRVDFDSSLTNVEAVRFSVDSSAWDGQFMVSCAEMEFYRRNPDNFDPLTLFRSEACDSLKDGVTDEDIKNCPNPLFRSIAYFMKRNEYPREFRIASYKAYPNPEDDVRRLKTAHYSKYDNPTGIYVKRGEELIVLASGIEQGYSVSVRIQNLEQGYDAGGIIFNYDVQGTDNEPNSSARARKSAYTRLCAHPKSEADGGEDVMPTEPQPNASCPLHNGINKMYAASDGLVYVMYMSSHSENAPGIKVHFATGGVNGYFDLSKHKKEEWRRLIDAAQDKHFDVLGKYAHLTFPTADLRNNITGGDGFDLIYVYDKLVYLEWKFMGLLSPSDEKFKGWEGLPDEKDTPEGYGGRQKNHVYFHVDYSPKAFMYASSYHTGYAAGTMKDIMCNIKLLRDDGEIWGQAHEVGHVNQTRPGLKWAGMTEVTNNLHSIYVQSHLNPERPDRRDAKVATRLQTEAMDGGYVNRYEKAMNYYMVEGLVHNYQEEHEADMDVFCKLVPMWQLHLYLTEVLGKGTYKTCGIYADIYEAVRRRSATDDDRRNDGWQQVQFVKTVCDAAEMDLTEFFTSYGFLTPIDFELDDYGSSHFTVRQDDIEAVKSAISGKPLPAHDFRYICDANVAMYKANQDVTQGSATLAGAKLTFTGGANVVAYEIVGSDGKVKQILLNTTNSATPTAGRTEFPLNVTFNRNSDKIFAVGVKKGDRQEVVVSQ